MKTHERLHTNGVLKTTNREVTITNGEPMHRMIICNVSVGSQDFVKGYLGQRMKNSKRVCQDK